MGTKSNDISLKDILDNIEKCAIQLPEFQRNWVWSDQQIRKLIQSLSEGFPMGAVMFLEYNPHKLPFKYRSFEGVQNKGIVPSYLVLDGQQRLTSLFQVLKSLSSVKTCLEHNKDRQIERFYYLDIRKCLAPNFDMLDAIVSMPANKIIAEDIGRNIKLDLSSREKEYQAMMFPLNVIFSGDEREEWGYGLYDYLRNTSNEDNQIFRQFRSKILNNITTYKIPVIYIDSDTEKEAVCQIFENVNTGGVPLTVFELVTAMFAAEDFDLRADWSAIKALFSNRNVDLLEAVDAPNFLTAVTLLNSYRKSLKDEGVVSCKRRDVLKLSVEEYRENKELLVSGFLKAADFLVHRGIYTSKDLPYSTQLIPLAAMFAFDETNSKKLQDNINSARDKLVRWYWCGVLGELYGGANETRFALDIAGFFRWLDNDESVPDTVTRAGFQAIRLLSLSTRNSAAYKGIMALVLNNAPKDFMNGEVMNVATYLDESTDIHHIFPQAYCEKFNLPRRKWNSVINKSPIYARTNRSIGGRAPSEYLTTMQKKGRTETEITEILDSHKINYDILKQDAFDQFIVNRARQLIHLIEQAMGKSVSGKDSEETTKEFGTAL